MQPANPAPGLDYDPPSSGDGSRLGLLAIALMTLLIIGAILNYLDRMAISTLAPTLQDEFLIDNAKWGWINSSFSLVYIFTSLFGGWWIDRIGVRKGLAISTTVWALAAAGHALAGGFWTLCMWRMLLALGEGPGAAAMVKGARRLMPRRLRDTGNGLINAGWAAGALFSPIIVGPLAHSHGWKSAFLVTGGLCFAWIPLWLFFSGLSRGRLGPQAVNLSAASDTQPNRLQWRSLALWGVLLGIFFTVPPTVFANSFIPIYLKQVRGFTPLQASRVYWQPFLATDIGQILGGLLVFGLLRLGWHFLPARRIVMIVGFSGAIIMWRASTAPTAGWAMWYIDLSRFSFQIGYTVLLAYGIESVAENQTALMAGMMNATFSACNFLFSPLIGWMTMRFKGFNQVFVMIAIFPLLGLACWLVLSQMHANAMKRKGAEGFPVVTS